MNKNTTFAVIGGDLRLSYLAEALANYGHTVFCYGIFDNHKTHNNYILCKDINDAVRDAKVVVLPLPFSVDRHNLHAPRLQKNLSLDEVCSALLPGQIVVGGNLSDEFSNILKSKGIKCFDYFSREELVIKNIIPTVEGAIQIAMEETPYTIHSCNCCLLGFGRISKLLAKYLKSLGANVSVFARKYSDLALIHTYGYTPCEYKDIERIISDANIIFNTVPALVIDEAVLKAINDDALIIDLASRPGGVDFDSATVLSKKVIWALSLPGKVAPVTSGQIIANTILNILSEEGI